MIDMSPEAVDGRLRRVALLEQAARQSPGHVVYQRDALLAARRMLPKSSVDMSPEAIESRLRDVSQLRRLCLELALQE